MISKRSLQKSLQLRKTLILISILLLIFFPTTFSQAEVAWSELTDLSMTQPYTDFYHINTMDTGQLLTRIGHDVWQGNADIYPIDPTVTGAGDINKRAGHYWSQFLMAAQDWLTDRVESEGEFLISFDVLQNSGKLIEYEGTWGFRDLFTTTAHHWVWIEDATHYHRVAVSMDVIKDITDCRLAWTELLNSPDAYQYAVTKTKDDGIQSRDITGTSYSHQLFNYELDPDGGWLALTHPRNSQAGSVARILLGASSNLETPHFVNPVWADYAAFDNIELHVFRQFPGITLPAGTKFYLDNLLITSPLVDRYDWIDGATLRAKEYIDLFEICPPVASPENITVFDMEFGDPVIEVTIGGNGQGAISTWRSSTTAHSCEGSLAWRYTLPGTIGGNYPEIRMLVPSEKRDWTGAHELKVQIYYDLNGTKTGWTIKPALVTPTEDIPLGNWNAGATGVPPETWTEHSWDLSGGADLSQVLQIRWWYHDGDGWESLAKSGNVDVYFDDVIVSTPSKVGFWEIY